MRKSEQHPCAEPLDVKKLLIDFAGLLLVGDGILTLADPKRHCLLYEIGPKPCRDLVDQFAQHPTMSRWAGLVEAIAGLLLAESQKPSRWEMHS
jgi:hypothetical protein